MAGFYDLLREYNASPVETTAKEVNADSLAKLSVPFVAETSQGGMIVTKVTPTAVTTVSQDDKTSDMPIADFLKLWSGKAITVTVTLKTAETNVKAHRFKVRSYRVETWAIWLCALLLLTTLGVVNGLFDRWSTIVLAMLNAVGTYICYLLILKDSHVKSHAADSVCGVIEREGCSTVLSKGASVFMGLFPWCQIGFTYFSISFLTLFIYPAAIPYLSWAAMFALPFTIWSVSYQKFKAHAWCTLCLTVQTLFWLEFIVYLTGGLIENIFPLHFNLVPLLAVYLLTLLVVNRMVPRIFTAEIASGEASAASSTVDMLPGANDKGDKSSSDPAAAKVRDTAGIHVNLS